MDGSTFHRYWFTLEYDGGFFSGWQWQYGAPSVQETFQQALFSLTQETGVCHAAGRTDKGVHACGQSVHFDLRRPWCEDTLRKGLNFYLKDKAISILSVRAVPPSFHARFSAQYRSYTYQILNRSSSSALYGQRAWWIHRPLDVQQMNDAASLLQGTHDFSSFRHRDCQSASPIKTLDQLRVEAQGEGVFIHAQAKSFLHRQVRMMVGALVYVGLGKWTPAYLERVLHGKKTLVGAMTAPAHGLYLRHVGYETI